MATDPKQSRKELQQFYVDFLTQSGYRPDLDTDGDVRFKHEGFTYFIQVLETQPEFYRVVLPNFWELETPEERTQVTKHANALNAERSLAKIFIVRDDTWCAGEFFLPSKEKFIEIFPRAIVAVDAARAAFSARMRKEQPKDLFELAPERGSLTAAHAELRQKLVEFLGDEGFRPKELPGGEVSFAVAGRTANLQVFAADADAVLLAISKFRPISGESDRQLVATQSQQVTADIKAAIVYPENDETHCVATVMMPTPDTMLRTFKAMVSAIRAIPAPDLKKSWWKRILAN